MILRWRNLPKVAEYMYTDHHIALQEHKRWFQRIQNDPTCRYWIITYDQEEVGLVNLYAIDQTNRRCYWAFYVSNPKVRGKGVGSFTEYSILRYVFDELQFNRLCCEVLSFNEPIIKMHKGFGFVQEGYLRQHVIKGGRPVDVVSLGMLREEWYARKPEIEERMRRRGFLGNGDETGTKGYEKTQPNPIWGTVGAER